MDERFVSTLITATVAILALALVWIWVSNPLAQDIKKRVPGIDMASQDGIKQVLHTTVDIEGAFQLFDGVPASIQGAWPRFRGRYADNISRDAIALSADWHNQAPPIRWSVQLGAGYAGAAIFAGRVFVLDYDVALQGDALRCFSLDDGKELWRRWYGVPIKPNHGMSRTVPAVTEQYTVTIGPKCHVLCVDTDTGAFRWGLDLAEEYDTAVPLWYTGQCPLIDGTIAVIAPGGRALMIGIDCATGDIVWETPNPKGWHMSHSSIIPMAFHGRNMYVYCALGGMVGVSADEEDRGVVVWETTAWNHAVIAPSPVILDDGRIFVTAGYGVGSMMLQCAEENNQFSITPLYSLDRKVFACEQHTPIFYEGYLYGILPNDAGPLKRQCACLHPDGHLVWTSGPTHRFGLGPFLIADGKMYILNDEGELTVIQATPQKYAQLSTIKLFEAHEAWAPMALVNGRLVLRDIERLICVDIGEEQEYD
ncbi:MAG: PQQ-binding-like beta-propeller repeat protein [bacterium]